MKIDWQGRVESTRWPAYALLDSGHRRKLERFGEVTVVRSEPKAWWAPRRPEKDWQRADAVLEEDSGRWQLNGKVPRTWTMEYGGVRFEARLTDGSKHLGIFPEQEPHWRWMREQIGEADGAPRVLNLFGYTGAASLVAASAGARLTHVDASKPSVQWARHNQSLSGMEEQPLRWLVEDARRYAQREIRRGSRYEGLLLDPPSFGRGPKGEVWKVETMLPELLADCRKLLGTQARFLILTLYNLEASVLQLVPLLEDALGELGGSLTIGELALPHEGDARLLPLSLYARWSA